MRADTSGNNTLVGNLALPWKHVRRMCQRWSPTASRTMRARRHDLQVEWPLREDAPLEVVDFHAQRIVPLTWDASRTTDRDTSASESRLPDFVAWRSFRIVAIALPAALIGAGATVVTLRTSEPAAAPAASVDGRSAVGQSVSEVVIVAPGGRVWVDGTFRGSAPIDIRDLSPGEHDVDVRGPFGRVRQHVRVDGPTTVSLVVPARVAAEPSAVATRGVRDQPVAPRPRPGWVRIPLAFPAQVFDGDRLLGSTDQDRLQISAGVHRLRLVNDALNFHVVKEVSVRPGETLSLATSLPTGTLSINALPWARVTIDGRDIGDTPLGNVVVPIGSHEVTFRHPRLGEQRRTVVIAADRSIRVSVNLE